MRKVWRVISLIMIVVLSFSMPVLADIPYHAGDGTLGLDVTALEYERVPQKSHIIIDKEGYIPSAKKVFYIYGKKLGAEFQIVDMKAGEVVLTGNMRELETEEKERNLYIGDFSQLTKEGIYRIYQDNVGYSDEFAIDSDIYKDMYLAVMQEIKTAKHSTEEDMIATLANVMLTKEIYPSVEISDEYIKKRMDLLIEKKDEFNDSESVVTPQTAALMAGVMAQYYYLYRDMDLMYSNTVLSAANSAYIIADRNKEEIPLDNMYYAASMLYRVTGYQKYATAIADYDNQLAGAKKSTSGIDFTILADEAYLNTGYRVDYERCQSIFNKYVNIASEISMSADKAHFYVQKNIDELDDDVILSNMMILGMVSYVLSSHEYASIQGNYIHYLFGVNGSQCNHMKEIIDNEEVSLSEDALKLSKLLFVLGSGESAGTI